jgi:hypothetical protein
MGKASRRKHAQQDETRIVLSPREFADFQGVCAVAAIKVQAIQQQAAQQIAAAQQDRQKAFLRLVKKYRAQGMRPDGEYRFDEATHSLIAVPATETP